MAFLNKLLINTMIRAAADRKSKGSASPKSNKTGGGFLKNIDKSQLRKAILDGAPDRNRGPKTGFGGFGMAGGVAVPNVKGKRSNLPPMSLAEILARRNIDFNPFQSGRQGLPSKQVQPQEQPMPPQGQPMTPQMQPSQAQPQPEMVGFLSKLVQQGVYPDLATAFRATMTPNQGADMTAPTGDRRGPSGIASMLPLIAGRLFGGGR